MSCSRLTKRSSHLSLSWMKLEHASWFRGELTTYTYIANPLSRVFVTFRRLQNLESVGGARLFRRTVVWKTWMTNTFNEENVKFTFSLDVTKIDLNSRFAEFISTKIRDSHLDMTFVCPRLQVRNWRIMSAEREEGGGGGGWREWRRYNKNHQSVLDAEVYKF